MRLAADGNALMSRRDDPSHRRRLSIHGEHTSTSMHGSRRMSDRPPAIDWGKVEEMTPVLLHLTSFEEHGAVRTWKRNASGSRRTSSPPGTPGGRDR